MLKSQKCFLKGQKMLERPKGVKEGQRSLKMGHKVIKSEKTIKGEKAKKFEKAKNVENAKKC
jgi:hypothetical protein